MKEKLADYLSKLTFKKKRNLLDLFFVALYSVYKKIRNILANSDHRSASRIYLKAKKIERNIKGGKYGFVNVDELFKWTIEWIKSFPISYDIVIGIPRSGLLVASIIALKLGKPLTTPELFCQNKFFMSDLMDKEENYKNILLVDDSITSGKNMEKSFQLVRSLEKDSNITKAALIATRDTIKKLDLYYKIIPHPRVFEWNLLHAKKGKLASDLDGVICENCPPGYDLNEELYTEWIRNAKPNLIPNFEIDVIVSNRLDKYLSETEKWLDKHRIRYNELILWNIQSKQERKGRQAERKIEVLLKIKPDMFWESNFFQAKQIWEATKIPTICFDEMFLFG